MENDPASWATVAGIAIFAALTFATLSYIRAVNALGRFIREKKERLVQENRLPDWDRDLYIRPGDIHPRDLFLWISRVVLGIRRLDIQDKDYRALLWMARRRLLVCLVLFVALVIGLGWFTQGTMH